MWSAGTNAALAAHGLDFLSSYIGGRATSLGQPVGAVVASAFAWFEPTMVAALYDAAGAALPHAQLVSIRDEATVASLRAALGVEDPSEVADLLAAAGERAGGAGRPLFSGLLQRGRPSDPVHRLWWACDVVREHRGDSHVAAANVARLGPVEMNVLTELWVGMPLMSYTATRGWSPEAMQEAVDALTARGLISGEQLTESGRAAGLGRGRHRRAGAVDRRRAGRQARRGVCAARAVGGALHRGRCVPARHLQAGRGLSCPRVGAGRAGV